LSENAIAPDLGLRSAQRREPRFRSFSAEKKTLAEWGHLGTANVSTAFGSTGSIGRRASAIKTTGADSRLSWRTLSRALASARLSPPGTAFLGLFRRKKH
jgi:hypothetical protein